MTQPTAYLMIAGEAIAYAEDGEIVATSDFDERGAPRWESAGVCDRRGGGGAYGYGCLQTALNAAELNAKLVLEIENTVRVRT